jgi:pimeloyl-ACP methyl ester carboxylesterase
MRAERQKNPQLLGDRPLIVLTRGESITSGPMVEQRETERRQQQADLATLSSRGKQVVVPDSGHQIHIDQPGAVTDAIREVLNVISKER